MNPKIPYGSESFRAKNPHLFPLAGVRTPKPKSNERGEGEDRRVEASASSVRRCVVLTTYRPRLLDSHDNARQALKPIVDALVEKLGFSNDADERITYEYHQIKSNTIQGTHILIKEILE